jgi:site-specific DNA-cytosine methylase
MSKTALSLYSGTGGLDLGMAAAGFRIVASVEQDADCCATLCANGFGSVTRASVEEFCSSGAFRQLATAAGELDLLFAGPPCQPFSKEALMIRGRRLLPRSCRLLSSFDRGPCCWKTLRGLPGTVDSNLFLRG